MKESSDNLEYEKAAVYRNQIDAMNHFLQKQKKIIQNFSNKDVLTVAVQNKIGIGFLLRIRNGKLIGKEHFKLSINNTYELDNVLLDFFKQYYLATSDIPDQVLIPNAIDNVIYYESWLSSMCDKKVKVVVPKVGEKKELINLCQKNADLSLKQVLIKQKDYSRISKSVLQLQKDLNLDCLPRHIEGFDNSHLSGTYATSSMVCFINGKPAKRKYRKFHIKNINTNDDFASMHEVITRHYQKAIKMNNNLPDLILVDGGKGQLSIAKSALDKIGLGYVPVIALAKKLEEVFIPGYNKPQGISKTSAGLYLLRKVRDEAHRTAITFHRKTRNNNMIKSSLENIDGIGKKTLDKIWTHYDSLEDIRSSSIKDIMNKIKISKKLASLIIEYLNKDKK